MATNDPNKPAANAKKDDELTSLLTKLYTIQEDIGAKPKTTDEEKKEKAANIATSMGSGKKTEKKGSRFLELKSSIVDRLREIHELLKETKEKEAAGFGGDNAKEIIKKQAEVREQIRQATDEWKEMDDLYKKEARKKKSKFTEEELEVQSTLVERLHSEIEKVKEAQMRGYARGKDSGGGVTFNTQALYADTGTTPSSGGSKNPSWAGTGGGVAMTDGQRQQIQQLEARDAEFDKTLDEIGEGIQDLAEIAQLQGEEVKKQSAMLDNVNAKMDKVTDRMTNVNAKMKETLEEVGRSGDKMCCDIICIVLTIGFVAVLWNFIKS